MVFFESQKQPEASFKVSNTQRGRVCGPGERQRSLTRWIQFVHVYFFKGRLTDAGTMKPEVHEYGAEELKIGFNCYE